MPTPAAFLSYARQDDKQNEGHISELRVLLEREIQNITGEESFRIFQDVEDITWGEQWQIRINDSISGSVLLIPVISPRFFKRPACCDELEKFLEREKQLGRGDLILPIYFIDVPNLNEGSSDELMRVVATRNYTDWREQRLEDLKTIESRKRIAHLAKQMRDALERAPTPEELDLRRKNKFYSRLEELQDRVGGPFRSSLVLQGLAEQLRAIDIDTLERLLNHSSEDLRGAGLDVEAIQAIVEELAVYGQKLRRHSDPLRPLDKLVLTPGCRNAVRAAGIQTVDELASKSWNELMLTGHFLPVEIEEVSLRLHTELGRDLRECDEALLTSDDILAGRKSPQ